MECGNFAFYCPLFGNIEYGSVFYLDNSRILILCSPSQSVHRVQANLVRQILYSCRKLRLSAIVPRLRQIADLCSAELQNKHGELMRYVSLVDAPLQRLSGRACLPSWLPKPSVRSSAGDECIQGIKYFHHFPVTFFHIRPLFFQKPCLQFMVQTLIAPSACCMNHPTGPPVFEAALLAG